MSLFELSVYCIWVNICLCECLFASCVLPLSASCLHQCEQCEHASDKLARVWLCVYVSCLPSTYKHVCVCVWSKWARVLPSAWVATLSAAELSPWPLLLWATTLKRYLVSGMRFWMVTCISPGRLVFTTRSLIGGVGVGRTQTGNGTVNHSDLKLPRRFCLMLVCKKQSEVAFRAPNILVPNTCA